jgi:arabinofuranosyltransferase
MKKAVKDKSYRFTDVDLARRLTFVMFVLLTLILGWQSDDSFHGYVMVKHLLEGNGFVYNIGERVCATTGPLYTLSCAIPYALTKEMFFTTIILDVVYSSAAYWIFVYKICRTREQVLAGFFAFILSKAFMSYTTSGLENSLLFLFSALFIWQYMKRDYFDGKALLLLALTFSGVALTRMDAVLYFIPSIVFVYLLKRDKVSFIKCVGIALLGLSPFFIWELFSLFYFGSPVPNTAYVKIGTGITLIDYVKHGILYYWFTFLNDAVVLIVPFFFLISSMMIRKMKYLTVAAGIILYGAYILSIGGDFMMGRHFTVMLFISVLSLTAMLNREKEPFEKMKHIRSIYTAAVIAATVWSMTFGSVVGSQYLYGHIYGSNISDEREFYFPTTGFCNNIRSLIKTGKTCWQDTWSDEGLEYIRREEFKGSIVENAAGILVYNNSDIYLNDTYCLGDPLMSRLPAAYHQAWRVGHLRRVCPEEYRYSVEEDRNIISDPDLHEFYDKILMITRGGLFSKERIKTILEMNTGKYDHLIESYTKRHPEILVAEE